MRRDILSFKTVKVKIMHNLECSKFNESRVLYIILVYSLIRYAH